MTADPNPTAPHARESVCQIPASRFSLQVLHFSGNSPSGLEGGLEANSNWPKRDERSFPLPTLVRRFKFGNR